MTYPLGIGITLGPSKAGLALAAQLYSLSGTAVGSEITTGFYEVGDGDYSWYYTLFPNDVRCGVKFYATGTSTILAHVVINPEEAEYTGIIENNYSLRSWLRLVGAVLFGKVTDSGTTNPKFRDTTDTTDRISAVVDTDGNRTSITLDDT